MDKLINYFDQRYEAFKVSDNKLIKHEKGSSYNSDLIYLTKNRINYLSQNNLIS